VSASALVGLGANEGDPLANLHGAVSRMRAGALGDATVVRCSGIYESTAVGGPGQNFLNAVVVLETDIPPAELLAGMLALEHAMGRVRRERWGPRTLDLDLLVWLPAGADISVIHHGAPELPHPRMTDRDFVLLPLLDVWPRLQVNGHDVAAHLGRLPPERRAVLRRTHYDL